MSLLHTHNAKALAAYLVLEAMLALKLLYAHNVSVFFLYLSKVQSSQFTQKCRSYDYFIVSFDLATEVFSLIPGPPGHRCNSLAKISLSTFEGKLALLSMGRRGIHPNHLYSVFHVWLLEEDLGVIYGEMEMD